MQLKSQDKSRPKTGAQSGAIFQYSWGPVECR